MSRFSCALECLESRTLFAAGDLDVSFGAHGILNDASLAKGHAVGVVPVSDGKLLVALESRGNFKLIRLNEDGKLDTTFGRSGQILTDLGGTDNPVGLLRTGRKVLVYGSSGPGGNAALVRYQLDGRLDKSLNGTGKLILNEPGSVAGVDDMGRIKILGDDFLYSFNSDGTTDGTFGSDGKVALQTLKDTIGITDISGIAVLSDGGMELGGSAPAPEFEVSAIGTAILNPDGSIQESHIDNSSDFAVQLTGMKRLADDSVATSYVDDFGHEDGYALGGVGTPYEFEEITPDDVHTIQVGDGSLRAFSVQPDGSVYATGSISLNLPNHQKSNKQIFVARYTPDREIDPGFASGGFTLTSIGNADLLPNNVDVDSKGRVLVTGPLNGDLFIACYQTAPANPFAYINWNHTLVVTGRELADAFLIESSPSGKRITVSLGAETLDFAAYQVKKIILSAGDGNDSIKLTTAKRAIIRGEGGNDTIVGAAGKDSLDGGDGDDSITGGSGNDTIDGGPGQDTILAQAGTDRIFAADGSVDSINGGSGADTADTDHDLVNDLLSNVETVLP